MKKEGWFLSDCRGSVSGTPQLQKDDEAGIFANDKEAMIFVINRAEEGCQEAKDALIRLVQENPKELLMLTKNI